ncbi:hypothetical protein C4900_02585 [Acidiferrobacter thiooxydans]|uniref:Uncharacterized protein n=1 Tax=Acidiferrobacter thiooxydans TaxID=163359 RepID=A0A368HH18_9GAMM|nr:hypothetical protein C4900_02585 [Acidiferrobacter thiooxydans]
MKSSTARHIEGRRFAKRRQQRLTEVKNDRGHLGGRQWRGRFFVRALAFPETVSGHGRAGGCPKGLTTGRWGASHPHRSYRPRGRASQHGLPRRKRGLGARAGPGHYWLGDEDSNLG